MTSHRYALFILNSRVSLQKFRAHDTRHPRRNEIYAVAQQISAEIEQHGHKYDSSWITRPIGENETAASILCGHSERLAIAFNFLVEPETTRIQLAKNLRICGDCRKRAAVPSSPLIACRCRRGDETDSGHSKMRDHRSRCQPFPRVRHGRSLLMQRLFLKGTLVVTHRKRSHLIGRRMRRMLRQFCA